MNNKRSHGPLSFVVVMGAVLVVASYLIPLFVSLQSALGSELWPLLRFAGWILIAVGVIRAGLLRRRAQRVVKAKEAAGLRGELETARELSKLDAGYHVFNRIYVFHGGRHQEFDHIVVGPNGVFHIESKNWAGVIEVTDNSVRRSVRGGDHDAAEQMHRHHTLLIALLRDNGIPASVHGILCFTNRSAEIHGRSTSYWHVRLGELVVTIVRHKPKQRLANGDVARIVRLIEENSEAHAYFQ